MTGRVLRRLAVLLALCIAGVVLGSGAAAAHPLGNFTVNHYNGLTVRPDRLDLVTVIDSAEIPTLQNRPDADSDRDGTVSDVEANEVARSQCDAIRNDITVSVNGTRLTWTSRASMLEYPPGEAGLLTTRLTCNLTTPLGDDRGQLELRDEHRTDRVGWHEMTAAGVGVALPTASVPATSISDELRAYPDDLLSSPQDVRLATISFEPGTGTAAAPAGTAGGDWFDGLVSGATRTFTDLAGSGDLTPLVGALAILLSLVLGAAHAALPGHGKTVMAAYLAGKRGTRRDALVVGATVTVTHTVGVLVLGLVISASSTIAGEGVLRWLGFLSGLLVAGIGITLLYSALRARRSHQTTLTPQPQLVAVGAGTESIAKGHGHGHAHGHGHGHGFGRGGLIGMGVAGGLVPSPSALVVLLGAIALGRTWFGVVLVIGYGLGMAVTLTAVGLLLVRLQDRLDRWEAGHRVRHRIDRMARALPVLTAALVLVVGLGLAARAAAGGM